MQQTQTQVQYKGRYGSQRPTQEQLALLRRMHIREDVIRNLTRAQAFELINAELREYTRRLEAAALQRRSKYGHT